MKKNSYIKTGEKFIRPISIFGWETTLYIFFAILLGFASTGCKKDDDTDTTPEYDNSLIFAKGNGDTYAIVNPIDGKDLFVVSAQTYQIREMVPGYMSKKVMITSFSGPGTNVPILYICDAKTGDNVEALTDANELYVMNIAGSPAGNKVAFTAKDANAAEYFQLYTINEDGSDQAHISLPLEEVTGLDGKEYELLDIGHPSFSPNGSKIAVNAHVDNIYSIPNSIFYDGVMVMNSDGSNKEFLFWVNGLDTGIENICWTQDGKFLIFKMDDLDNNFHRRVKAVNIATKNITDITTSLEINGTQVGNIWTSPKSDKVLFNQHVGGWSDIFVSEFEKQDSVLIMKGAPAKLTDINTANHQYDNPYWQLWDKQ